MHPSDPRQKLGEKTHFWRKIFFILFRNSYLVLIPEKKMKNGEKKIEKIKNPIKINETATWDLHFWINSLP